MRLECEREEEEKYRGPQVSVEDAAPVGSHRHGVDHVFDVELVEAKRAEPDGHPPARGARGYTVRQGCRRGGAGAVPHL